MLLNSWPVKVKAGQKQKVTMGFSSAEVAEPFMPRLRPGTTHHYVLTAKAPGQNSTWIIKQGTFKMLQRMVRVKFKKIKILDDGDEAGGPGDFKFGFAVNGQHWYNGKRLVYPPATGFLAGLSTDESRNLSIEVSFEAKDEVQQNKLALAARGYDDRDEIGVAGIVGIEPWDTPLSDQFNPTKGADTGDTAEWEWTTAKAEFDISQMSAFVVFFQMPGSKKLKLPPQGTVEKDGESWSHPFILQGIGLEVDFEVIGAVGVFYKK